MHLTPSADSDHGHVQGKFFHFIDEFLDIDPSGKAYLEVDIFLPDGGDPLRPDINFVSSTRSVASSFRTYPFVCSLRSFFFKRFPLGQTFLMHGIFFEITCNQRPCIDKYIQQSSP